MKITSGKVIRPQKVVIYGSEGIGKTSMAAQFPNPLFIDTEGGTVQHQIVIPSCAPDAVGKFLVVACAAFVGLCQKLLRLGGILAVFSHDPL